MIPHCYPITSWLLSPLLHTSLSIYISKTIVTSKDNCFSPTEMPLVRHDKGGIGRNWWQGCSTISVREMQKTWQQCYYFHQHHHLSWFTVQINFSPPLQICRGKIWFRTSEQKISLDPVTCLYECLFSVFLNACMLSFYVIMINNELSSLVFYNKFSISLISLFLFAWLIKAAVGST